MERAFIEQNSANSTFCLPNLCCEPTDHFYDAWIGRVTGPISVVVDVVQAPWSQRLYDGARGCSSGNPER